jgi:histidine ammonia-lyase
MGATSGRKALGILANTENVIAIELLTAAQGLDLRAPLEPAAGTAAARAAVRSVSPHLDEDRPLSAEIETVAATIAAGDFSAAVEDEVGSLD